MKILMTGISGMIGSALAPYLRAAGHQVIGLTRKPSRADRNQLFFWDPGNRLLEPQALDGVDAIIHLAGENIAKGKWTRKRKQALLDSRVKSTELLASAVQSLPEPPKCFISASAVGYYGDTGETLVDEDAPAATDFLGTLASQWEAPLEALSASTSVRTVMLRFGMVLSPSGGALKTMLPAFRMGGGAVLGSGRQWVSWISLLDVLRLVDTILKDDSWTGPVNSVTPEPVPFRTFAKTLGKVLNRPVLLRVPGPIVRFLFGEMGQAVLMSSCRAHPAKLEAKGFTFEHPTLESALEALLASS